MADRITGSSYNRFTNTAAGTAVITADEATIRGVYVPGATTGTVTIWDASSAAGTVANRMLEVANNTFDQPTTVPFDVRFRNGITAIASAGTTDMTIIWDK